MSRLSLTARAALSLAALVVISATDAQAQGWQWSLTPYIWTTDVGVDVKFKDQPIVNQTIAFSDLIEDLDAAVQVRFEGQTGSHGFTTDLFFVSLSKTGSQMSLPTGGSITADGTMRMTIFDGAAMFNPRGGQRGLTLLYGARIIVEKIEIDATFTPPPAAQSTSHESKDTLVDALIGARYTQRLGSGWSVIGKADASTGGTEYTWSAGADVVYAFGARDRFAVTAGYRYLAIEFKSELPLDFKTTMSGFAGGFRFAF